MTYRTPVIAATIILTVSVLTRFVDNPLKPAVLAGNTEAPTPAVTAAPSPTATPAPSPTPTLTPTPKPKPTIKPTPTPKPQPEFTSEQIYNMINKYSGEKGVDPNVIRRLAICESGFNPKARNYIYGGLFQYAPATWKSYRKMMGADPDPDLMFNAEEAIKMTVFIVAQGKLYHWPNCQP